MRVSTGMIYDSGVSSMQNRTQTLLRTQQQVSSGKRILAPSDDPVAAAQALVLEQSQAVNNSQDKTRNSAKNSLGIADNQLKSATDLLGRVHELAVQAGNAALSPTDRKSLATELRQRFTELIGIANTSDGSGFSLFGGYQSSNRPFAGSVENGVTYSGDDGQQALQVGTGRQMTVSSSGNQIFMDVANGNGVFVSGIQSGKSINQHTAAVAAATVTDANAWNDPINSGNLQVKFWADTNGTVAPANAVGAVYYDLIDASTGTSLLTGNAAATSAQAGMPRYQDGAALDFSGLDAAYANPSAAPAGAASFGARITMTGVPANGDTFAITRPSAGLIATAATSVAAQHVGATIDAGTVTNPTKWSQVANSGNLELRFWTDQSGGATSAGYATGSGPIPVLPITFAGGDNSFNLTLNGAGAPVQVTVGAGVAYTTAIELRDAVQAGVDTALGGVGLATVSLDASNHLVVTSTTQGTLSSVALSAFGADTGFGTLFTTAASTPGTLTAPVTTPGYALGSVAPTFPYTLAAGTNDQFDIAVDGGVAATATLVGGPFTTPTALKTAVQAAITAAGRAATVSVDASNRLVVTSNSTGAASAVTLTATGANTGLSGLFGVPQPTVGTSSTPGTVFYDLVDADTGTSMFTNTASTTGATGTYTHRYTPGAAISLASSLSPAFDFGASVTVAGTPNNGDIFTIKSSSDTASGNGYFVTDEKTNAASNLGSGIIGKGEVLDEAKWNSSANSRQLEIRFRKDTTVVPTKLYYDLVDTQTDKSLLTGTNSSSGGAANTYLREFHSGDSISFAGLASAYGDFGISVSINGSPENGDVFTVDKSESTSVFDNIANLITALEGPAAPVGATSVNAQLQNHIGFFLTNLSHNEDSISTARAQIGSNLSEIDSLDSAGQSLDVQLSKTLSSLQDLDYAKAITDLTRQQTELQAAQKSFQMVAQLSLFSYL